MAIRFFFLQLLILVALIANANSAKLSPTFYEKVCPQALPAIKKVVDAAVKKERRMGASLLRLHFHDCFVNGCDGSVLLDDTSSFTGEKTALPNLNSARGFDVIDDIKAEVDRVCGGSTVSCADILAVAARDSVVALGGPTWNVPLGRRDSKTASKDAAESDIPAPNMDLSQLISNFKSHGLGSKDLVALSGGHTLGFARCVIFRDRIHNETNIDSSFARSRRASCPSSGGDNNLAPLDTTPARFDVHYFKSLVKEKGLLHSDQELYNGGSTDRLVKSYSGDPKAFSQDFARSMVKLGNIKPLTGKNGQVREKCRRVN